MRAVHLAVLVAFAALLAGAFAAPAQAAASTVPAAPVQPDWSPASISCNAFGSSCETLSLEVGVGDLLVSSAHSYGDSGEGNLYPTDTLGNSFSAGQVCWSSDIQAEVEIGYAVVTTGGSDQFTFPEPLGGEGFVFGSVTDVGYVGATWSDADIDSGACNTGSSTDSAGNAWANVSDTVTGGLVFGAFAMENYPPGTFPSPQVTLNTSNNPGHDYSGGQAYNGTADPASAVYMTGWVGPDVPYLSAAVAFYEPGFSCAVNVPGYLGSQAVENGTVYAYINVSSGTAPYEVTVDWGDATNTTVIDTSDTYVTPSHYYAVDPPGTTYDITVTVDDVTPAETTCAGFINVFPVLTATWTYSPTHPVANASIYLAAYLHGGDTASATYSWAFLPDDIALGGSPGNYGNTSVVLSKPGTYHAWLNVTDVVGYTASHEETLTVGTGSGGDGPPPCSNCGSPGREYTVLGVPADDIVYALIALAVVVLIAAVAMRPANRRHGPP